MVEATNRAPFKLSSVQREHRTELLKKLASGHYHLEDVLACPCGSTDAMPLASHDRFGLPVGAVLCGSCGLARSTPHLSTVDLPDFYQHAYHGLHMSLPAPDPVDGACSAAAAGGEVTTAGCEYASAYVEAGRSVGTDMRQGGPEMLRDLAPFDVVILSHVVEHLPDLSAGLADVRALGNRPASSMSRSPACSPSTASGSTDFDSIGT